VFTLPHTLKGLSGSFPIEDPMAGWPGVRTAIPDAYPAEGLHANSSFWLPEQLHSTPQTGGYPALFIAAAQTRSDTGEPGVSAMLAVSSL
jgi:hypothetical protein